MQPTRQYQQSSTIVKFPTTRQPSNCRHKSAMGIGVTQILLGITSIAAGIASAVLEHSIGVVGTGIWCGLFIILTGAFGCLSATKRTLCLVITSMVLSIICVSVFCTTMLALHSVALVIQLYESYDCDGCIAIDRILITVAVVSGILAIISSGLSCANCCCVKYATPRVVYVTGQQGTIPTTDLTYAVQDGQPSGMVYVMPTSTENMYPYNNPSTQFSVGQTTPGYPTGSDYTMTQTMPSNQTFPPSYGQSNVLPGHVADQSLGGSNTKVPL